MVSLKQRHSSSNPLEPRIVTMRGQRVILDADLARLYGVPTKRFNEAVRRNRHRFPPDFAFQLTAVETVNLKSQIATSSLQPIDEPLDTVNSSQSVMSSLQHSAVSVDTSDRSQFATGSQKHRDPRFRPWVFTEHGALMAANVLRSQQAVEMSVFVVRAFVRLREQTAANHAILKRLAEIDRSLLQHDSALRDLYHKLLPLLQPPMEPRRRIGFHAPAARLVAA